MDQFIVNSHQDYIKAPLDDSLRSDFVVKHFSSNSKCIFHMLFEANILVDFLTIFAFSNASSHLKSLDITMKNCLSDCVACVNSYHDSIQLFKKKYSASFDLEIMTNFQKNIFEWDCKRQQETLTNFTTELCKIFEMNKENQNLPMKNLKKKSLYIVFEVLKYPLTLKNENINDLFHKYIMNIQKKSTLKLSDQIFPGIIYLTLHHDKETRLWARSTLDKINLPIQFENFMEMKEIIQDLIWYLKENEIKETLYYFNYSSTSNREIFKSLSWLITKMDKQAIDDGLLKLYPNLFDIFVHQLKKKSPEDEILNPVLNCVYMLWKKESSVFATQDKKIIFELIDIILLHPSFENYCVSTEKTEDKILDINFCWLTIYFEKRSELQQNILDRILQKKIESFQLWSEAIKMYLTTKISMITSKSILENSETILLLNFFLTKEEEQKTYYRELASTVNFDQENLKFFFEKFHSEKNLTNADSFTKEEKLKKKNLWKSISSFNKAIWETIFIKKFYKSKRIFFETNLILGFHHIVLVDLIKSPLATEFNENLIFCRNVVLSILKSYCQSQDKDDFNKLLSIYRGEILFWLVSPVEELRHFASTILYKATGQTSEESVKMISALLAFSKIYPGEFWTSLVRLLEIFNKNCSFEETPFMLPFIKHMTSIIGEILCILYTVDEGESHKGLNLPKLWVETWTFINHVLQSSAIWAKKSKDARHLVKNFLPEIFAFTSFLLDVDLPKYTAGDDFSEDEFSNFLNFPFMLALSSNFPWFSTHDDRLRLESVDLCCRMLRFAAKVEDWEIPQEIIDQVGKFADKTIATPLQDRERERLLNWDNLDVSDFAEEELLIVDNMKVDNDIKRDNDVVGRELVDIMDVDSELKKAPEEKSDIVEEKNILNEKTTVNKEAVQPIVENKISKKDTMLAWQMMAKAKKQNQSSKKPGLKSSIMKQLRNDVIAESRRIQLKPAVNSYKGYDQSFEVTPLSELTEFEVSRPKRTMQKIDLPNATLHPSQVRIQNMQQPKIKALGDISSLHKQLLLWTFPPQGKNIFPPGFDKDSLKVIPKSFENTREYATVFEPLMVLECWEQFCHAKDEVRKSDAVLTSISEVNAVDGFYDIVFNADAALVRMRNISDHDLVQICEVKNSDINVAIGTLPILAKINSSFCKKDSCTITARIFPSTRRPDIIPRLRPGSSWSLLRLISLITAHREYTAMLNLPMVPLSSQIMNPGKVVLGSGYKINSKNVKELTKKFDINEPQASAVDACVGQKSGFVLIQGPPGTGKTKTIMTIIGSLLTHSTSLNASTSGKGTIIQVPVRTRATKPSIGDNSVVGNKKRLLCCAPSNAACDELVRRLRDGVQDYSGKKRFVPNVVRMGTLKSVHEDVKDLCLELLVEAKFMEAKEFQHFLKSTTVASAKEKSNLQQMEKINRERDNLNDLLVSAQSGLEISEISNKLRDLNDKRKDLMREIFEEKSKKAENKNSLDSVKIKVKQRILSEADVIVSTLSSAGHDTLLNAKLEFPTVIIDEACQSIELSGIIPLKYGAKKCILVGDPNQLPPTVLSNLGKEYQYEQSLFQRIMLSIPNQVHLLSIQYRMHPMISSFPSKLFYESKLIDGGGLMEKRKAEWHDKEVLSPYRFFNVKGTEQKKSGGKSVYNLAEIDAIVSLINYLCISYPGVNFAHRIGVITPYKLQYFKIRDRLVELGGERILKVIDLNTVDGFQGQEKDIIILSCVRGGIDKGIGFLGDVRRMNVAFTRAKCSLFVVGNAEALKTNEQWRVFVEDAVARNVLSKWNETTLSNYNNFNFFPGNLFGTISLKRCIDKVANGT